MSDESHLDQKYFIDSEIYNCPFCNRRHVTYENLGCRVFDWSINKACFVWFIKCNSCGNTSMHLTFSDLLRENCTRTFREGLELDNYFFYSVPTSFFVIDSRIPQIIRELITEAEGCTKMNFLTGASACCRKAIYELTITEKAEGDNYEQRIKFLKKKFFNVDPELFDILCAIKDMTSDKVHEQSWDKWDTKHLKLFLETLKAVLHEIYVIPDERKKSSSKVKILFSCINPKQDKPQEVK